MKANSYVKVESLEEAYELVKKSPFNKVLGGGLWLKKGNVNADALIDLSKIGLDKIEDKGEYVEVGALVTQRAFEKSKLIKSIGHGLLSEAVSHIMGPAFRECATIGGSVAGKFGFSDLLTALLVFKTTLVFYPSGEKSLEEYLKEVGQTKEILTHVRIKKCMAKTYFKKVAITALDYPIINVAIKRCPKSGHYAVAIGSRAGVSELAYKVNEYLNNGGTDFEKAAELIEDMKFADSLSAKADYRKHLAKVYVKRGLEEVSK